MGKGPQVHQTRQNDMHDGALTDHWNVRGEAKDFLRLVLSGRQTIEHAKLDILMTQHQFETLLNSRSGEFAMLLNSRSGEFAMLQRIKWKREQTYKALLGMYQQATGKAVAA